MIIKFNLGNYIRFTGNHHVLLSSWIMEFTGCVYDIIYIIIVSKTLSVVSLDLYDDRYRKAFFSFQIPTFGFGVMYF